MFVACLPGESAGLQNRPEQPRDAVRDEEPAPEGRDCWLQVQIQGCGGPTEGGFVPSGEERFTLAYLKSFSE